MSKVVDFTEALKKKTEEREIEEELENLDTDTYFALSFSVDAIHDIVDVMSEFGYDIGNDSKTILEIMLIIESIRAMIMRCVGKEYPFQNVAEQLFKDEEGQPLDHTELLNDFLKELDQL